ncbi:MAG: UTP--glucose-1-phosphate uridylyltransferase [Planctomycetes bacterium]|nr:UTP--glucose-1-phosphate uridylyltransferase [Planctomycetota bacterium]
MTVATGAADGGKPERADLDILCGLYGQMAAIEGQDHLFNSWKTLKKDKIAKRRLLQQVAAIDWVLLRKLIAQAKSGGADVPRPSKLEPAPVIRLPKTEQDRARDAKARAAGEDALRAGKVGVYTVAGGQGTRLGYDAPKGVFPVGPVTQRTLFELHAEKIDGLRKRYGAAVPWAIMTSDANDEATRAHFAERKFYGLPPESVRFAKQDSLPAIDPSGKILMSGPGDLALSPNGHGGSIKAMHDAGILDWYKQQGVATIFYFQVDNPLVKICDPVFLGHHLLAQAEMSSKIVRKRDWKEPVGVIGYLDGTLGVIEYSDLPEDLAKQTGPDGGLRFWAGNIAIHVLERAFVERLNAGGFQLPYHLARKHVPCIGPDGKAAALKPGEKNGIKFETFIFDALGAARASATVEAAREDDFGPIKNAEGEDSPATARAYLVERYAGWLEAAGHRIPRGPDGKPALNLEISGRTSLEGEGLNNIQLPPVQPGGHVVL